MRQRASRRGACVQRPFAIALTGMLTATLAWSEPTTARAQSWGGQLAAATALTGLEAGLGAWVLTMPWGGFWSSQPQPGDGWAIAAGVAATGLVSTSTFFVARGHPERAELVSVVSAGGLALSAAIAFFGGLYALVSVYDRLALSMVFGVPVLASAVIALVAGLAHLAVEGDAPVTPLPLVSPLAARF